MAWCGGLNGGRFNALDEAITDFLRRYADQNERAYASCVDAVRRGRIDAVDGV